MPKDSLPPRPSPIPDEAGADKDDVSLRVDEIRELEKKIIKKKQALLLGTSAMPLDEAAEQFSFLLVRAAGQLLALSTLYVDEVVQMPALMPVEESVRAVSGLANYHGELIAVIDVPALIAGQKSKVRQSMALVICPVKPRRLGLMVEEAVDVVLVNRNALTVSDEMLPGTVKATGVLQLEDEMAFVVDVLWISLGTQLANLLRTDSVIPAPAEPK